MRLFLLLSILVSVNCLSLKAQNDAPKKFHGEFWVGIQFAVPVGEFAASIDRDLGFGGNIGGVWCPSKESNFFQFGFETGVNYMGKEKRQIEGVDLKTISTLWTFHLLARFTAPTKIKLVPYIDVLGGGKMFYTKTKYNNDLVDAIFKDEDLSVFAENNSSVWSYGVGVGFNFTTGDILGSTDYPNVVFDCRVVYMVSGNMSYVSPDNVRKDPDGSYYYEVTEINKTDMIFPQIGIKAIF